MPRSPIRFSPAELSAQIRDAADDSADPEKVIAAVRTHLAHFQPILLPYLSFDTDGGLIVLQISDAAPRGLRIGVEAALGLESKAPETEMEEITGEIQVPPDLFAIELSDECDTALTKEELRSWVRFYPLPTCEWYEISDGILSISNRNVMFKSAYQILGDEKSRAVRHYYDIADVAQYGKDYWWNVPCLRIETGRARYRYGWATNYDEISLEFKIEEWLIVLGRIAPHAERIPFFTS